MIEIDPKLAKEFCDTADWLLDFPDKLVSTILKPQESYLRRRERIHKLKEIVEIREIAKEIQRLYLSKGSLVHWIQELQSTRRIEDAAHVRELFQEVKSGITRIREAVTETSISDTSLGAEAAMFLSRTELVYQNLSGLPDEALVNDKVVAEIASLLERIIEAASTRLEKLDEHRKLLDHTYGD